MTAAAAEAFAPAKINLALHVTGRRADGYHLLDSLVAFADIGDRVRVAAAGVLTLEVTGPRAAGVPADGANLVIRAAGLLAPGRGARIVLEKHLPAAAGIGGGSSDAAAAVRALARHWGLALPEAGALLPLGADVPVCFAARAARMTGIGEALAPVPELPEAGLVLVNPGVAVSTPSVFRALARRDNAPMPEPEPWPDAAALAGWLARTRNDLEAPARAIAPEIAAVLTAIGGQEGCLLARMSGSGATCFGLFASRGAAAAAAEGIRAAAAPGWWVEAGGFCPVQATRATT